MSGTALALVVGAAFIHAAWNALAKRGQDPFVFLWASQSLAALLFLPLGLWWMATDGVGVRAVPFVVATGILHALYFYALGRSYRSGEFSVVYPVARGLGVALVPVLALLLLEERLSPLGTAGIVLVVVGIVALHAPGLRSAAARASWTGGGTGWALVTGLSIACYSLVDKAGVSRLNPVPYLVLMGLGSSVLLLPAVLARLPALRREWALNRWSIVIASTMNLTAYLLVLFAFRLAKVGYVVAARELSIVLSAFIGSRLMGEGRLAPRLAGAAIILAGVVCVAFAR